VSARSAVYTSYDEDSRRWQRLPLRDDDIVISTRSKTGTTWVQMICALLVFRTPELPRRLVELSPWLDWLMRPIDDVVADLEAQNHRRFIKTHTPLDGLPLRPGVAYPVTARHPLDVAVSLYHHRDNLDRERLAELKAHLGPDHHSESHKPGPSPTRDRIPLDEAVHGWVAWDGPPAGGLDTLTGLMWHLARAWELRDRYRVVLVHYRDLVDNLPGEMRRLADALGFTITNEEIIELATAADFHTMKARASETTPDFGGIFKDPAGFFRGCSGQGLAEARPETVELYRQRLEETLPPELVAWLDR
jgi:hypothetical protein